MFLDISAPSVNPTFSITTFETSIYKYIYEFLWVRGGLFCLAFVFFYQKFHLTLSMGFDFPIVYWPFQSPWFVIYLQIFRNTYTVQLLYTVQQPLSAEKVD